MYNNEEYLAHHGIIGQRWGKKNGPPYPLDRKVSAKVKKQGRKRKDAEYQKQREKQKAGEDVKTEGSSMGETIRRMNRMANAYNQDHGTNYGTGELVRKLTNDAEYQRQREAMRNGDKSVETEGFSLGKKKKKGLFNKQTPVKEVDNDSYNVDKVKEIIDEDKKYINARNYGEKDLHNLSRRFNAETDYNDALQRKFNSEVNMWNANNRRLSRKERAKYDKMMAKYERETEYNRAVNDHIQSQINLIRSQETMKQLTTKPKRKSLIRRGAEWTGKWATDVTKAGLYAAGTRATTLVFDELFNRGFNAYYNRSSKHKTYVPNELPNPLLNAGGGGKKGNKKNK